MFIVLILLLFTTSLYAQDNLFQKELYGKAIAEYEKGELKKALRYFNEYIDLGGNETDAYFYRAQTRQYLEDYRGAVTDFDKLIELDEADEQILYLKANALFEMNFFNDALNSVNKAILIDSTYSDARFLRASIFYLQDHCPLAEKDLYWLLKNDVELSAAAFYYLGKCARESEDYTIARDYFKQASELDPEDAELWYELGYVQIDLEDYKSAINSFDRALELDSNFAKSYHERGLAQYFLHNTDKACADWLKAKNLGSKLAAKKIEEFCGEVEGE